MAENDSKKYIFEGSNVEDAIEKALEALQVDRDDIDVKVVNEEKKGLFGMEGTEPAKIVVFKKQIGQ